MASAAVGRAMNLADQQNIHPFFTKPLRQQSPEHTRDPDSALTDALPQDENQPNVEESTSKKPQPRGQPPATKTRNGKRKPDEDHVPPKVKQVSLVAFTQGSVAQKKEAGTVSNVSEATSLEEDPNIERRKRQKTTSPEPVQHAETLTVEGLDLADQEDGKMKQDEQPSWIQQLETEAEKEPEQVEVEASSPDVSVEKPATFDSDTMLGTSPRLGEDADDSRKARVPPSSPPPLQYSPARSQPTPRKNAIPVLSSPSKPSPPKKMLRINAKGRFSSPVSKEPRDDSNNTGTQRKTRSRGNKKGPKQLIVKISYIKDDERAVQMAEDIDEILAGVKRAPDLKTDAPSKSSEPSKPSKPAKPAKRTGPPKPTHPFFTGKTNRKDMDNAKAGDNSHAPPTEAPTKPSTRRETAITPGKLRAQARAAEDTSEHHGFGIFGNSAKPRRTLGGAEAPWPWKGVTRVGDEEEFQTAMELSSELKVSALPFKERRKFKSVAFDVPETEAILPRFTHELHRSMLQQDASIHHDNAVRLPQRLLTTGPEIQRRVRSEVQALVSNSSGFLEARLENQLESGGESVHPALTYLFESIASTLTPFDVGVCETLPWVQKYAPKRTADVLGSSMEISVMRRWLESLKVNAVGVGIRELGKSGKSKKNGGAKPPKKKRKTEELDDFIVSDEDGLGELDDLTDPDDTSRPSSSHGAKRSMIRSGGDVTNADGVRKLQNLILLSGPHGCGKTAAVYAVAKELGFEVFEINPGSRRNGKDVLEKIGDMTENHLVQRRAMEQPEQLAVDSDTERLSAAVQKDIESGRQKSMGSFFKPVSQAKAKSKAPPRIEREVKAIKKTAQPTLGKPKQSQKQSLILLEEVDVLFEDDKNFWQTVEHLAVHSKRPIVLTCTDESLVRMNESSLHAILRMAPAPTDLVADYLLLLAAREGHLLHRKAMSNLYESKNHDLRASITELDFWCQMAVGDRKGGLEWMYQRWPPGKDVDEHGQTLRVASQDTYQTGMGWVGHDMLLADDYIGFDKEYELMLELTESWNLEPEAYSSTIQPGNPMDLGGFDRFSNLKALWNMEHLTDQSSAADMCCRVGILTRNQPIMDPTQPPLPEKARANFIDGYAFLQTDAMTDFTNFDTHLAVSSHLAAKRCNNTTDLHAEAALSLPSLDESDIATAILTHLSSSRQSRSLNRADFFVFDPLAEPPTATLTSASGSGMTASSFDRTFRIVVEDLAPYVRSIAAFDMRLENERLLVSNMLSAGGKPKRQRTTRAARSALEGGRRETTRRERWFDRNLNLAAVMRTAGAGWAGMGAVVRDGTETGSARSVGGSDAEMVE